MTRSDSWCSCSRWVDILFDYPFVVYGWKKLLDKSSTWIQGDEQLLHIAQRLIIKLARVSGILPSSLSIEGVNNVTPRAIRGGAFADIYRAQYGGKEVALKKFRVFECHDRHNTHRVC